MIYDKIVKLCDERHISIWSLEKKAGLSHGAIARWRTMKPKADTLYKVARFFELPLEFFLEGES